MSEQKQPSEAHSLSGKERLAWLLPDNIVNKSQADASGFSPGLWPKRHWWAASLGLTLTHRKPVSTSKIIRQGLCFTFPCSLSPVLISSLLATSFLSLPVAGNSHNCRPQFPPPPSQEVMGSGWTESECSAPVGVRQQLANKGCCYPPQRQCFSKLEVRSLNTAISDSGSLKFFADWRECLTNNCCELGQLIWNYSIIAVSWGGDCKTI